MAKIHFYTFGKSVAKIHFYTFGKSVAKIHFYTFGKSVAKNVVYTYTFRKSASVTDMTKIFFITHVKKHQVCTT